ncbi:MAG: hypothetical protein ABSC29_03520 [Minisyncoccia bacterium]|jgi:chromosome segregation ATPase
MSVLGRAVEALTLGLVHEVSDTEERPPIVAEEGAHAGVAQAALTSPRPIAAASAAPVAAGEIAAAVAKRASKDLEAVLAATPERFQQFLVKKNELAEVLREGGADPAKIESVATTKAIKALKLTIADVTDAAGAAKQALEGIRAEFAATVQGTEQERVTQPTAGIAETEARIGSIRETIAGLQEQITQLQSGIAPARAAIATAQANLEKGKAIFEGSCGRVQASLQAMETAILAAMQR